MCQCVNRVTLIGFLGDAPELKFSQQGKPVCTFSVAVNERWKDAVGAPRERVEWFQIVCFARLAEVCGEYLNKGRHVYLEGRLQTRKWEDRGGEKRTAIEVVANQMHILDRAPKNGNGASRAEPSKSAEPVDEGDNPFREPGSETRDEEIPLGYGLRFRVHLLPYSLWQEASYRPRGGAWDGAQRDHDFWRIVIGITRRFLPINPLTNLFCN